MAHAFLTNSVPTLFFCHVAHAKRAGCFVRVIAVKAHRLGIAGLAAAAASFETVVAIYCEINFSKVPGSPKN